jgi:hypothetical protein
MPRRREHHHKEHAASIEFCFTVGHGRHRKEIHLRGKHMQFTMPSNNAAGAASTVSVIGSPVDANQKTSQATLTNAAYTSSDPTVFTIAVDPNTPNGGIITAVAVGTATLTEVATATEPGGATTEQIQGVATIVITAVVPPPLGPAAALVFTFGTPQ